MKVPNIIGKNKIRDVQICKMYVADNKSATDIASTFKISATRVYKILYNNREFVKADNNWEKIKRIHWLKKQVGNRQSKKDPADLLEQIRKEIEGDKPLIDQSHHTHITKVELKISDDTRTPLTQESGNRLQKRGEIQSLNSGEKIR